MLISYDWYIEPACPTILCLWGVLPSRPGASGWSRSDMGCWTRWACLGPIQQRSSEVLKRPVQGLHHTSCYWEPRAKTKASGWVALSNGGSSTWNRVCVAGGLQSLRRMAILYSLCIIMKPTLTRPTPHSPGGFETIVCGQNLRLRDCGCTLLMLSLQWGWGTAQTPALQPEAQWARGANSCAPFQSFPFLLTRPPHHDSQFLVVFAAWFHRLLGKALPALAGRLWWPNEWIPG